MTVWEDLIVKNAGDLEMVKRGHMKESDVRQTKVRFKVDTGAHWNVITHDVLAALGLTVTGKRPVLLAGGRTGEMEETEGLQLWWRDRHINMDALVAPSGANNLLSCTALELLALKVNPVATCLEPAFANGIMGEIE